MVLRDGLERVDVGTVGFVVVEGGEGGVAVCWRVWGVTRAHVGADHKTAALDGYSAEEGEPGVPAVGSRGEVEVDVLRVEGLSHQRHVVLPADSCRKVDAYAADGGADCPESGGRTLGPDKSLRSGLKACQSNPMVYRGAGLTGMTFLRLPMIPRSGHT